MGASLGLDNLGNLASSYVTVRLAQSPPGSGAFKCSHKCLVLLFLQFDIG